MKVKDLLEQLKSYDGEDELIVAYWDKKIIESYGSGWGDKPDLALTDEQWSEVIENYENGEWYFQSSAAEDFVEIAQKVVANTDKG
jgi:arabinogalactan endo-1,4-beta-galactosidase